MLATLTKITLFASMALWVVTTALLGWTPVAVVLPCLGMLMAYLRLFPTDRGIESDVTPDVTPAEKDGRCDLGRFSHHPDYIGGIWLRR